MIGSYATGIFPRPRKLIEFTRLYDRGRITEKELDKAFEDATLKIIDAQILAELSYVTDGMLKWQDLFRPFTENLNGVKMGSLARWFNNNTFYRKPVIVDDLSRNKSIVQAITHFKHLPPNLPWKAVLPAPYTFAQLSENRYYKNKTELMFKYAKILREEIESLTKLGFKYVQLSDPALVYKPTAISAVREELEIIGEALGIAVKGIPIKTCLQTFFGDFSQILPEALDFPVDHLGIDFYETDIEKLKEYAFEKGVALGLVDSRSSLIENQNELVTVAKEFIELAYCHELSEVFVCPNCDLEFLPWEKAERKMKVVGAVAKSLREEFDE
jgi:5-methyltetrahydropteroyltriglutamate--homocysteine methyltransferase